jgi:hypothetical protein
VFLSGSRNGCAALKLTVPYNKPADLKGDVSPGTVLLLQATDSFHAEVAVVRQKVVMSIKRQNLISAMTCARTGGEGID